MIEIFEKTDLLDLFEKNKLDGIAHQTNIERVMGAGIAKEIAQRFPASLLALQQGQGVLGNVTTAKVDHGLIFNVTAQSFHGMGRKTNYEAFYKGFEVVEFLSKQQKNGFRLGVPYMIGCGLGGGSWKVVFSIFEEIFDNSSVELVICQK
jgi:O-acetyl-ADP-ribose deacetylase (regulator of RNase III)